MAEWAFRGLLLKLGLLLGWLIDLGLTFGLACFAVFRFFGAESKFDVKKDYLILLAALAGLFFRVIMYFVNYDKRLLENKAKKIENERDAVRLEMEREELRMKKIENDERERKLNGDGN